MRRAWRESPIDRAHAFVLAHALSFACAAASTTLACSTSSGGGVAGPGDASGTAAPTLCATDSRAQTFHAGLEQVGASGRFKVKLLDISPNPVAHGDNRWNIAIADSTGAAVAGATLSLVPFMPDRGKPASQPPTLVADPLPGQYTASRIELPIAGVWTFTFDITAKGVNDKVVFTFCVDE